MVKKILVVVFVLALVAGGSFYWLRSHGGAGPGGAMGGMHMGMGGPMPVAVLKLQPQSIHLTQSLPARISAYKQAEIRPQVNGIITERMFEEGSKVEEGQQLYQIDDARYKAALASAQAALESAQANVKTLEAKAKRYEELVKIDAVSRQQYDDVKAQLDQAKADIAVANAAIDTAQVNLDYTKVYAPISGEIGRSFVTQGALVTANQTQPLAVITQLDPVYVDMQQSDEQAIQMRMSKTVIDGLGVTVDLNGQPYDQQGHLKFSEVTVDESTGATTLRAVMPNPAGMLLPGLFVRAKLDLGANEGTILVPQRAAMRTPDGNLTVWAVKDDNSVEPRILQTAGTYKSDWVVTDGVKAGDTIIVEGYQKVGPGSKVVPSPWQDENAQQGTQQAPDQSKGQE